jgi:hypothetical protein
LKSVAKKIPRQAAAKRQVVLQIFAHSSLASRVLARLKNIT